MNLGQLIDPEWVYEGCPGRFAVVRQAAPTELHVRTHTGQGLLDTTAPVPKMPEVDEAKRSAAASCASCAARAAT